jgi:hypothetical protein
MLGFRPHLDFQAVADAHNAQRWCEKCSETKKQLAEAQAAMKIKNLALAHLIGCLVASGFQILESDRDALLLSSDSDNYRSLSATIAAAQQPLVDALTDAAKMLNEIHVFEHLGDCGGNDCPTFKMAQRLDALAKVKEGK